MFAMVYELVYFQRAKAHWKSAGVLARRTKVYTYCVIIHESMTYIRDVFLAFFLLMPFKRGVPVRDVRYFI